MPKSNHILRHISRREPVNAGELSLKIIEALNSPRYSWRTIGGIAKDTGINVDAVKNILAHDENIRRRLKVSLRRGRGSCPLFMTKEKFDRHASFIDKILDVYVSPRILDKKYGIKRVLAGDA